MTIIVASKTARVMVADTLVTAGDVRLYHVSKVVVCRDGSLAAAAGDNDDCVKFLEWAKAGRKGALEDLEELDGVVLTKAGDILLYSNSSTPIPVHDDVVAIGSGAPVALGALHAGADPGAAVVAAITHCTRCGGVAEVFYL